MMGRWERVGCGQISTCRVNDGSWCVRCCRRGQTSNAGSQAELLAVAQVQSTIAARRACHHETTPRLTISRHRRQTVAQDDSGFNRAKSNVTGIPQEIRDNAILIHRSWGKLPFICNPRSILRRQPDPSFSSVVVFIVQPPNLPRLCRISSVRNVGCLRDPHHLRRRPVVAIHLRHRSLRRE